MTSFFKYHGAGNDFVFLDERGLSTPLDDSLVRQLCHRRFGVGADGVLLLSPNDRYDFELTLYNADGQKGSLCGNGSRCAVHAAFRMGFVDERCTFITYDGVHRARMHSDGTIGVMLNNPSEITTIGDHYFCDTGSPHIVLYEENVDEADVPGRGKQLRNDESIHEGGSNVNFVEEKADDVLKVRTFERGVEEETWSCGTGAVACALVQAHRKDISGDHIIAIEQLGGTLSVSFSRDEDGAFEDIWLRGPVASPFQGKWEPL